MPNYYFYDNKEVIFFCELRFFLRGINLRLKTRFWRNTGLSLKYSKNIKF